MRRVTSLLLLMLFCSVTAFSQNANNKGASQKTEKQKLAIVKANNDVSAEMDLIEQQALSSSRKANEDVLRILRGSTAYGKANEYGTLFFGTFDTDVPGTWNNVATPVWNSYAGDFDPINTDFYYVTDADTDELLQVDVTYSFTLDNPVTETVAETILPGEELDYTFATTADMTAIGDYTFIACTELVGDEVPDNDCKEKVVSNWEFGEISGSTKNANTNAALVGVLIEAGGFSTTSTGGPFGAFYALEDLPAGMYEVVASKDGYFTATYPDVEVLPGEATTLNISLVPDVPVALPFMEMWDDTSFATNLWAFNPEVNNWQFETTLGNPAPAAEFYWSPSQTNYEHLMISRSLEGYAAKETEVVLFDYDLYLSNYSLSTVEAMGVDVWDGMDWVEVAYHDNQGGSIDWTTFSVEITDLITDLEFFKVRFRAFGENTFNINYWCIDNIKIYQTTFVNFSGTITELSTGNPIEGATIMLDNTRLDVVTGPDGTFDVDIQAGTYDVTLTADGYNTVVAEGVEILEDFVWDVAMTAPTLEVAPDAFVEEIEFGNSDDYTITVSNNGNGPVDWSANVQFASKSSGFNKYIPESVSSENVEEYGERVKPQGELTDAMFDLQFSFDAETASGLTGLAVAECDGNYFYATKWGNDQFVKYELDGTFVEIFTIPGVTGIRDLAYDGQYFYGSNATSTIYEMDFDNKTLVSTIAAAGPARAIAYDNINDGFWCNNWESPMLLIGRDGSQLNDIPGVPSIYGAAFDPYTAGGPYLWLHAGTTSGGGSWVEQWDIATKSFTGVMHSISGDLGPDFIAGGLFLVEDVVPGTYTLGGLAQGDPSLIFGYELGTTVDPWLSLDVTSGTLTGSKESQDLTMTLSTENLDLGQTYFADIVFSGTPDVGDQIVSVELFVSGDIGYIIGTVTDPVTRGPLEGVTITADGIRGFSTMTAEDGTYNLPVIGDSTYNVMAEKDGYISQTVENVAVVTGGNTAVDFELEFTPPELLSATPSFFDVALEWEGNSLLYNMKSRTSQDLLKISAVQPDPLLAHGPTVKLPVSSGRAVGDTCTDPIVIPALPYTDQNTTCGRGNSNDTTCLGYYDGGEDIFYQFTLAEAALVSITMETTTTWTGMLLTDECPADSTCIATATNVSAGGSTIEQNLVAGTYLIMIDTWPSPACIPDFTLTVEEVEECIVECPAGAIDEGEPCGESVNDGCNADVPAYTPIACGDVYCGTAWADDGSRDTDWYELVIEEPKTITWTVNAEFPVNALIIDGNMGCDDLVIVGQASSDECGVPAVATATLIPGTYWLFVGNQTFEGNPCGFENDYVAEVTCEEAFITYYNVYRDGVDIADVYGTTYLDEDVEGGNTYCYTVNQAYPGGETGMSNEICADVLFAPEIAADPTSVTESLYLGETSTQVLNVVNSGLGLLDFTVDVNFGKGLAPVKYSVPKSFEPQSRIKGSNENPTDEGIECPEDAILSQPAVNFSTAMNGDEDGGYILYQSFDGAGDIGGIRFWTISAFFDGAAWTACDGIDPRTFTIGFYEDDAGEPGNLVDEFVIDISRVNTNELFAGAYSIWEYTATLPSTVSLPAGWFSVQSMTGTSVDCWSLFLNEAGGTIGECLQYDIAGGTFTLQDEPMGFCLIGGGGPVTPWLTVDPLMGSIDGVGEFPLDLSFDPVDLTPGIYNATISIASNDPVMPVLDVPVELEVLAFTGTLTGFVTDATTRGPLEGVTITADGIRESTTTDEFGYYELELIVGEYAVTASKDGYISQTVQPVMIEDGVITEQDFMLEFAALELLYADGGIGQINLGWEANPSGRGEAVHPSYAAEIGNLERMHGPTAKLPYSSGRATGDDCTDPIVIGALPYTTLDSTCGRGNYTDTTCLGSYDGGEDIFYMLTLAEETAVSITMETATTWTGMLLTDECPPSADCIATASTSSSGGVQIQEVLPAGTYYIMIDTWPSPNCIPEFTLTVEEYEPCVVECPAGAIDEGEPCGEDLNGGCNADEFAVTPIECGDVFCGTAWADGGSRDTDWYELVITEPKTVTWSVTAEFPVLAFIIDGNFGCAGSTIISSATAAPCEEAVVTADLIPGTYWVWVGDQGFEGNPCGESNDYVAELTCAETFITYYNVFRDGEFLAETYYDTYMDTDIMPDTEYCYTVSQIIEPGLVTPMSNELCATMLCEMGCDYTLNFTDSWGDGWNGAAVTIIQDGTPIGDFTLASGSAGSAVVELCDDKVTELIWTPGSYPGECGFELVDPLGNVITSFVAGGAPAAGEFFTFTTECPEMLEQQVVMEEGWNAWSSHIDPQVRMGMEDLMAPIIDQMIITQYFGQLYYPEFGIMNMGEFTNQHGYLSKMSAPATLPLNGYMADPMVTIPEGWSLLPVLQDCSIPAADVFSNIAGFVIAWDPVGNAIYYPAGNLYTLVDLNPGMAYWIKVDAEATYTYPGCVKSSGTNSTSLRPVNNTSWNDVNFTPVNHAVIFDANATTAMQDGDMIGAFTSNNWCAGMVEYTGENLGFNLFGDDLTTDMADGFAEGENLTFKLFRPATEEEFEIDVTYDYEAPNADGLFAINGISVISDMKLSPTSIGENLLNGLSIYPNPSSGVFNIAIGNLDEEIDFVVLNAQGQEVYNGSLIESQQLDLSAEPKGVYFIKFINESVLGIEKLVIK